MQIHRKKGYILACRESNIWDLPQEKLASVLWKSVRGLNWCSCEQGQRQGFVSKGPKKLITSKFFNRVQFLFFHKKNIS